jgi:small subunit ribosomal protein S8e
MRKSTENLEGRKLTGGRKVSMRGRRKYEIDRYPNEATSGPQILTNRRSRGNNLKPAVKTAEFVNVADRSSGKVTKKKINRVTKNPANKDYERRGVISKGAILETDVGIAKVVSRPGQHGNINAVLLK